jgi:diguanylate cyclase (GGDEF)-like protein
MLGLNQKRTRQIALADTLPGGANDCGEGVRLDDMRQLRAAQRHIAEPSNRHITPGSLNDALLALAVAEQQLGGARRENESLRINNERLLHRLSETSRRAAAAQRLAHHDGLTGLPNRLLLIKRLQQAIKNAFERQRQLALLFIDLDGFKIVNDRFGHMVGDRLLTVVAARLAACVRADDIACRFGGDEFVALLSNIDDTAIAVRIAENIRERIDRRYLIDGNVIHVTASIGLAAYPADGKRYDVLLSCADASMYRSKVARRTQCRLSGATGSAATGPHRVPMAAT